MRYLRALLFQAGLISSSLVYGLIMPLLIWPLSHERRYRVLIQWGRFNIWWLRVTCGVRYRVRGLEHVDTSRPHVVMSKHQSAWETLAFVSIFPRQTWVLKRELMRIPLFGWALAMLQPVPIDRSAGRQALEGLLREGKKRLDQGLWVIVFPEGTRVNPGEKGRYRQGGAQLAARGGYPVLPVALNSGTYWPRHGILRRPGTIEVSVGPPIETQGRSAAEVLAQTEDWIESEMAQLEARDEASPREQ
ncbi:MULTISPECIES: 1-acyl-sn-glycerol-3-phosphate acyltransferase [unclassified Thioalkalivibrio]|uniref:lysophospholipid acyltransferase family protein n=1 Tax=unclassified Thioalkalivibrio TaxID=2621013 RepID=UPI00035C812C|nr:MULTISPECIES: lysophospholipid acyltransferase family protein [unclassified Thioalkalivibrio]PYG03466.1 1-acyl-sn-glycerol-3-phosphate acyltransferase [Thioalkalivibrio sp. ALE21]